MKSLVVVLGLCLTGCGAGIDTYYGHNRRMTIEHEVNFARPSFTKVTSEVCVPRENTVTVDIVDGETYRCEGVYVMADAPQFASQEGAATGLGSAVVLGGAAVGTGYVFGSSMPDDDYNTTNNTSSNGGSQSQGQVQGQQSISQASSKASARASSSSSSKSAISQPRRRH